MRKHTENYETVALKCSYKSFRLLY